MDGIRNIEAVIVSIKSHDLMPSDDTLGDASEAFGGFTELWKDRTAEDTLVAVQHWAQRLGQRVNGLLRSEA